MNVPSPRMRTNINMTTSLFTNLISYHTPPLLHTLQQHWPWFRVLDAFCFHDKVCSYCSFCLEHSYLPSPIHMSNPYLSFTYQLNVTSSKSVTFMTYSLYPPLIHSPRTIKLSFRVFMAVEILL